MYKCEIFSVKDETWDVKTFKLKRPADLTFVSGQYCTISFIDNPNFLGESRPFTFSSSPTEKEYFTLTIKKMHEFTTLLFELKQGDYLLVDGPFGVKLNFDDTIKDKIIFIAGGSGITPFMSALRYAADKKITNEIYLFYSNKTRADIIFHDEITRIAYNHKNFKFIHTITTDTCSGDIPECGRIDKAMIEKYVLNPKEYIYYVCGPPFMTDAMKTMLTSLGIKDSKIRIEDWKLPGKN